VEPAPVQTLPVQTMPVEETPAEATAMETTATEAAAAENAPTGRPGDARRTRVSRETLHTELAVGDRVLLADGAVELRVTALEEGAVHTEVVHGGIVRTRSGVNIPSERLVGPGLTDADRVAIPQALDLRADLIAQSFVRTADDVKALRELLPSDGPRVVAKIETRVAVDNFDAIVAEADGIMVARGDLGVDIPFEDVPLVQKDLTRRATAAGKFVIVATQMLESMTGAARPTRAEASDVANAVIDGTDAVMLSAETAIGSYPLESLEAMARICVAAERTPAGEPTAASTRDGVDPSTSIVLGASLLANNTGIGAVWCFTRSGRTAEMLSLQRPHVPIVAFTLSPIVARRLAVRGAVVPVVMPSGAKGGPLIERMENAWQSQRGPGGYDTVLLVTTSPQSSGINRLELHRLAGAGR
jgi:pyruvate kinase